MRFIERNARAGRDEIDAVFVDGETVVFVEVRYRSAGILFAAQSIDRRKAECLRRAARAYRAAEGLKRTPVRIDVVAVTRRDGRWIVAHTRAAYDADDPSRMSD
jgi:putative endonuclease